MQLIMTSFQSSQFQQHQEQGSHVTQAAVLSLDKDKLTFYHPSLFSKERLLSCLNDLTLPLRMTSATAFDTFACL